MKNVDFLYYVVLSLSAYDDWSHITPKDELGQTIHEQIVHDSQVALNKRSLRWSQTTPNERILCWSQTAPTGNMDWTHKTLSGWMLFIAVEQLLVDG